MPNRIIRGDLLDSDRYNSLTHDAERLLFVELLLLADDYGLVPVNFGFLRRRTTPCIAKSLEQVTQMVSALADADLIRCYQSERGGQFAFIPRFDNRPQALKPRWPIPPDTVSQGAIAAAQALSKGLYRKQALKPNATDTCSYVAPETETETETEKKDLNTLSPSAVAAVESADVLVIEKVKGPPPCPFTEIVAAYHEILPTCRRVIDLNPKRQEHMRARWRQVWAEERFDTSTGIAFFRRFFQTVSRSKFLTGRTTAAPGRNPFKASLPWLMNPENFLKVIEGNYE
jgi:hypothetical protein